MDHESVKFTFGNGLTTEAAVWFAFCRGDFQHQFTPHISKESGKVRF
jgi:hypothetical protein